MKPTPYPVIDPPETWWLAKREASAPIKVPGVYRITKNDIYVRESRGQNLYPLDQQILPKIRRNKEYFPTWSEAHKKLCEWLEQLISDNEAKKRILSEEVALAQSRLTALRLQYPPNEL